MDLSGRSNPKVCHAKLHIQVMYRPFPDLFDRCQVRDSILPGGLLPELFGRHGQNGVLRQHLFIGERGVGGEQVSVEGCAPAISLGARVGQAHAPYLRLVLGSRDVGITTLRDDANVPEAHHGRVLEVDVHQDGQVGQVSPSSRSEGPWGHCAWLHRHRSRRDARRPG